MPLPVLPVQLDRVQPPRSNQQQQGQPAAAAERVPAKQKGIPVPRPPPRSTVRTPLRYFMLRSVNSENWDLALREGCWATQPQNERVFDDAFGKHQEVVLFVSVQQSGSIQGYGRMMAPVGSASQVPWLDINADVVNNFYVSWDCAMPLPFDLVKHLANPWNDVRKGARSQGPPLPLHRHRDGQELAPKVGEGLLQAMNAHAAAAGKPASGPLAQRFAVASGASTGWRQQQPRSGAAGVLPQQQMQQQQRMLMMQQQQQQRGGMGARGVGGPMGMVGPAGGRGVMQPGRGMMQQQQPPPGGRPYGAAAGGGPPGGGRPGGGGGHLMSDPRLNPRFAGRLKMDGFDDFPPHPGGPGGGGGRGRSPPPPHGRSGEAGGREDERESDRDRDWRDSSRRDGWGGYDRGRSSRRHSRSRSRSPPRAASSRGGSTGRGGGEEEGLESSQADMSYEQYLATWEKVQARINLLKKQSSMSSSQAEQPEQQLALALVPGGPQQQQQAAAGAGSMMGGRGGPSAAAGGGGMGPEAGGVWMGGRMMAGGPAVGAAGAGGMMRQGVAAAAAGLGAVDGGVRPGRPTEDASRIPTLAE